MKSISFSAAVFFAELAIRRFDIREDVATVATTQNTRGLRVCTA